VNRGPAVVLAAAAAHHVGGWSGVDGDAGSRRSRYFNLAWGIA
jgi:hypothetical protein